MGKPRDLLVGVSCLRILGVVLRGKENQFVDFPFGARFKSNSWANQFSG